MAEFSDFRLIEKPKVKKPVIIVGLPGIGLVGKIVADYLIKKTKAKRFCYLYSGFFPSQVLMRRNGTVKMISQRFYYTKLNKKDVVIVTGDIQPYDSLGQYLISKATMDFLIKLKPEEIITIGGYATNQVIEHPRVFGSANSKKEIEKYTKLGVDFTTPKGGIVGAAGLLIGFARFKKLHGVCLMGETHGAYIDANAAKKVLEVLSKRFDFKIDYTELQKKIEKTEEIIRKTEEQIKKLKEQEGGKENLGYFR